MIILRLNCRRCGCDRNKARLLQNKTPRRDSATEQFQRRSSRCDVAAFACGAMRWDGGGARRDRTADLLHAMQALSQLGYGPTRSRRTLRTAPKLVKRAREPRAPAPHRCAPACASAPG